MDTAFIFCISFVGSVAVIAFVLLARIPWDTWKSTNSEVVSELSSMKVRVTHLSDKVNDSVSGLTSVKNKLAGLEIDVKQSQAFGEDATELFERTEQLEKHCAELEKLLKNCAVRDDIRHVKENVKQLQAKNQQLASFFKVWGVPAQRGAICNHAVFAEVDKPTEPTQHGVQAPARPSEEPIIWRASENVSESGSGSDSDRKCVTHHHACDCRETMMRQLASLSTHLAETVDVAMKEENLTTTHLRCKIIKEVRELVKNLGY